VPEQANLTYVLKGQSILGGRFVQQMGASSEEATPTQMGMYTYDSNEKNYRYWFFISSGFFTDFTGTWDESSQTFTFTDWLPRRGGATITQRFLDSLRSLGADIPYLIRFSDHHYYKTNDLERLAGAFTKESADYLITTEKDAVKLGKLFQALPILVLEIDIEWLQGKDHLERELTQLFEAADANIS